MTDHQPKTVLVNTDDFAHHLHEINNTLQALLMSTTILNLPNAPHLVEDAKDMITRGVKKAICQMIELEKIVK